MKPSQKVRQPADEGDLEQTKPIKKRQVAKQSKPQGKKASKPCEDENGAITFMSPAEQSAFYEWFERRERAAPRIKLHRDGTSAKKSRRPAPSKLDSHRAAATQSADMRRYPRKTGGVVVPEDVCVGAMPRDIMNPPSSDPGMNSPTTLWDSSVGQSASDPHVSQCPFTLPDSINLTKSSRDRRKSMMKTLTRRRAPVLPPTGLARRVNRLSAAMALFGAISALAWALALTSDTQTSRSNAKDSPGQLAIGEVKPQPRRAAEASSPAPVLAGLPQQASPDRLSGTIRAPQPAAEEAINVGSDEAVTATRSATVSTDASMRARPDSPVAAIMVDPPGQSAIGKVKPHPKGVAEASPSAPVLAALAQQAARQAQPAAADRWPNTRSLRSPVREKVSESDIPMPRKKPSTVSRAAVSKRVSEQIFDQGASKSPAPGNTAIDDTGAGDIDTGGKFSALNIDEASEQASDEGTDEAADEAAATRLAAVSTDVNMRAKPDNAAAVVMVVPAKSAVEVIGCDDWCEVVFAGKRGWIYQSFVGAAESTAGISGTAGLAKTTDRATETSIPSALPARRTPLGADGIGRLASLSADDLQKNLRALDLGDVRKLKTTCTEVLRSSAAYSADTRAVCKFVTSL